jgi:3'(2'), 5'-bisphosphate nucleotidase
VISRGLESLRPSHPVLSEESDSRDLKGRHEWRTYWLVDPLDGTKEFIKRNGEFTVNIALVDNHRPVLGVVYAPAMERIYTGLVGMGAWLSVEGSAERQITVSRDAHAPLRVVGSRSHASSALAAYLEMLGEYELRSIGSSLKICLVADGSADLYPRLGPTSEWDTAAAQAILESAGGSMIDTEGHELRYNVRDNLLNPHFLVFGDRSRNWLTGLEDTSESKKD